MLCHYFDITFTSSSIITADKYATFCILAHTKITLSPLLELTITKNNVIAVTKYTPMSWYKG